MEILSSLMVLVVLLIALGIIINGPAGGNWVFRTLVRNPSHAGLRATGRGLRGAIRWAFRHIEEGIIAFTRRYPRLVIIIILLLTIAIQIYLLAN
jgi:hypothetical protein